MRSRTAAHALGQSGRIGLPVNCPISHTHFYVQPRVGRVSAELLQPLCTFFSCLVRSLTLSHEFALQDCRQGRPAAFQPLTVPRWPFGVEVAFEAARDVEGLAESRLASSPWPRRASARPSGRETERASPGSAPAACSVCAVSATKFGIGLHGGIGLPLDAMHLAAQAGEIGQADEIPFRHRAHIHQLRLGFLGQKIPSLGGAEIAGIFVRRRSRHGSSLEKIRALPGVIAQHKRVTISRIQ